MRRVDYQGKEFLIFTRSGYRLLEAMRESGVQVECECATNPDSDKCTVKYPKDTAFLLTTPTARERRVLGEEQLGKGFRLACETLFK